VLFLLGYRVLLKYAPAQPPNPNTTLFPRD
jgi:hypothetical protein